MIRRTSPSHSEQSAPALAGPSHRPAQRLGRWLATGCCSVVLAAPAAASTVTYDLDFDSNGEAAGQVIDDEYETLYGITISANGTSGTSPDVAVIYDSEPPVGGDSDLEYDAATGYSGGGNRQFTRYENLLIIQENGNVVGNFVDSAPDDDGNGGSLTFTFNPVTHSAVDSMTLTWIDIDPPTGGDYTVQFNDSASGLSATVRFDQFVTSTAFWYDPTIVFGDHTANQFPTIDAADLFLNADIAPAAPMTQFDQVIFTMDSGGAFGSSGSIGAIAFGVVPEPSPPVLICLASVGALILRRRR